MDIYCKNCHQTHPVWSRLNNYLVCGHCGARVREAELQVTTPQLREQPAKPDHTDQQ
jgi:transcription initiation factor TFIIIB Brf1 subunit/transcription initiation factor TFIIB